MVILDSFGVNNLSNFFTLSLHLGCQACSNELHCAFDFHYGLFLSFGGYLHFLVSNQCTNCCSYDPHSILQSLYIFFFRKPCFKNYIDFLDKLRFKLIDRLADCNVPLTYRIDTVAHHVQFKVDLHYCMPSHSLPNFYIPHLRYSGNNIFYI